VRNVPRVGSIKVATTPIAAPARAQIAAYWSVARQDSGQTVHVAKAIVCLYRLLKTRNFESSLNSSQIGPAVSLMAGHRPIDTLATST
jgi:hypothetical protein